MLKIGTRVYTILNTKVVKAMQTTFPNINITDDSNKTSSPKFPCIYFHEIPSKEIADTLEGNNLNGILHSIQIDVLDSTKQYNTRAVMENICLVMKSLGYKIVSTPEYINTSSVYRMSARFRKAIANSDVLTIS